MRHIDPNAEDFDDKMMYINRIDGEALTLPTCAKCNEYMRPNINMRGDLDWNETQYNEQSKKFGDFLARPDIHKRSVTVLEIGAGPAQPLSREFGLMFLRNERYRCCVIRINPIKERTEQFKYESGQFEEIAREYKPNPDQ